MEENKNIVLACDVSTETIGICLILDDNTEYGKIIELTHISPKAPKKTSNSIEKLFLKKRCFEDFIKKYINFGITKVVIEEPLISSNNKNTVATLLRFNGMVSDAIYNILGIVPDYISSYDARRYSFPSLMAIRKYNKKGEMYPNKKIIKAIKDSAYTLFGGYPWDVDKKFVIHSKVKELFPDIEWLYNKKGELKKENFDATDAYVAGIAQIKKERYKELDIKTSKYEIKNNIVEYDIEYWGKSEHRKTYLSVEDDKKS